MSSSNICFKKKLMNKSLYHVKIKLNKSYYHKIREGIYMNEKEKYSVGQKIFGVVFMIWFVASLVGIIYFTGKENTAFAILIFGQYFFVFGIVGICSGGLTLKTSWILLFPAVGLVVMICSGLFIWGSDDITDQLTNLLPVMLISLFIVIGIGMVLGPIVNEKALKKRCTYQIIAKCVRLNKSYMGSGIDDVRKEVYAPVFSYYFRGNEYEIGYDVYKSYGNPEVNDSVEIFINPDNPSEIYWPKSGAKILVICIGLGFTIMGVFAMFMYLSLF